MELQRSEEEKVKATDKKKEKKGNCVVMHWEYHCEESIWQIAADWNNNQFHSIVVVMAASLYCIERLR